MLTIALVSVLVPVAVVGSYLARRRTLPKFATDSRGIALQTVIVMVVLLAIAGGAAAVLLTRGGEAVSELEDTEVTPPDLADVKSEALCEQLGGVWTTSPDKCT